jgi:mono/diheme cytochrome c family protein
MLAGMMAPGAHGQTMPRLQAVFPAGARQGSVVDVVLRGSLLGAQDVVVFNPDGTATGGGVQAQLHTSHATVDTSARALFQARCTACHELRGPDTRPFSPAQWEATVDRMIQRNHADIKPAERDRIVAYLKAVSANSQITATLTVDKDAVVGRHELRVATAGGASTAYPFFVTDQSDEVELGANHTAQTAQTLPVPGVMDGLVARNGQRDFFKFKGASGQRVEFHVLAYRLSEESQIVFNPCLFITGPDGKQVGRSYGGDELDPLLSVTLPADGEYVVEVRDLLFRGGPTCVYRLEAGDLGLKSTLFPLGARRGGEARFSVLSNDEPPRPWALTLAKDLGLGVQPFDTPFGQFRLEVSDYPEDTVGPANPRPVLHPPCVVNGVIGKPGDFGRFILAIESRDVDHLGKWATIGPFAGDKAAAFDRALPVEQDLLGAPGFVAAATYPGLKATLKYEIKDQPDDGTFNFSNEPDALWYAVTAISAPRDTDTTLVIGSDDWCKVWLNGQLVHTYKGQRPALRGSDLVPVHFKRGTSMLVAKIYNVKGGCGFHCTLPGFGIDCFAQRLGSPLHPKLRLGFGDKWIAEGRGEDSGDTRIDWNFDKPGRYGVQIEDAQGEGGERYAYRIEIGAIKPVFTLDAFPANPSLPQGGRMPVAVKRTSMAGFYGDVKVRLDGLPPGLHAEPAVIGPDHDHALILVQADDDAKPAWAPVRVVGEAAGVAGPVSVAAVPLDHFKLQNDAIALRRSSMLAEVLATLAPYEVIATTPQLVAAPGTTGVVHVKVQRAPGFSGDVYVSLWGLPHDQRVEVVALNASQSETDLHVPFPGNLQLGASEDPSAYRLVAVGFSGGDGLSGGMMLCSQPIRLIVPGPGVAMPAATVQPAAPVETPAALYQRRCSTCHAAFSPTKKRPDEWGAVVQRMISQNKARISDGERDEIVKYLMEAAKK